MKWLLFVVLIGCGVCHAVSARQSTVKPSPADTLHPVIADTLHPPNPDTATTLHFSFLPPDTLEPGPADTIRHDTLNFIPHPDTLNPHPDSLALARDSFRRRDSARQASYVPNAATLQHEIDSANSASTLSQTPAVDSLKLRMDAMMAAANNNTQKTTGLPNLAKSPNLPNAYTPTTGGANFAAAPAATAANASTANAPSSASPTPASGFPVRQGPPLAFARHNAPPPLSNFHRKTIQIRAGHTSLDTLSIIPGTFSIRDIDTGAYQLDWVNSSLTWSHPPARDSATIYYRTFPYKLNAVGRRFNYDSIMNYFLVRPYDGRKNGNGSDDNFFNFGNIAYNGSFGRSISFGNNQDAVVTSNLNLQISGYLADSIRIDAAITDNNIPIQPDGTTADLNEFDKIYLQFSRKNWALTMGDIDLKQNSNYFLSFYKRLQGASFETTEKLGDHFTNKILTSAAIAKGKFNRNIFEGQENNQGPYQLSGANNEAFFIVLAGTEKVFIDGQLMQRGENADYIINYNTAQVTFTANRLITQDARIQVEFEYADRNYLNVNLYLYDEAHIGDKLKLRMGVFSNSDARNSPIDQTLTSDENKFLAGLGNNIGHAYYPVANIDTFAAGRILYQKVDTTYKNAAGAIVHDSIYEFSTNTAVTLYNLSFANVGQGYGNYVPDLNNINGNVFIWLAPVNGVPQGSYDAAEFLVTPKTQQILTLGADYAVNKNTFITADVAGSNYDVNTLSSLDKNNDKGTAAKFTLKNTRPLNAGLLLTTNLGYEYVQKNFAPIEPLRSVEFTRDWGLTLSTSPATEKISTASFMLSDKRFNSLKYEIDRYERSDGFTGMRNSLVHRQTIDSFHIADQISLTTSDSNNFTGHYLRPSIDVSRKLPFLKNYTLGATWTLEDNENRDKKADTLAATSYLYHAWTVYLRSPEKNLNRWGMSYASRDNSYASGQNMALGDRSHTVNLFADLLRNPREQFHITATYRTLRVLDSAVDAKSPDSSSASIGSNNTLLARVEYLVNEWKGLLKGNLLYEIGSGQQQELSYTYLQVPAGTGQYAWIDYNKDGIQQLNEFVIAQFPDQAQYIRVYTPTGIFVRASYTTFNYSVSITPKALIGPKSSPFHIFLARMLFQSSLQMTQKQLAGNGIQWNPFKDPVQDTALITRTMIMANTFSFNRTDPHWGIDISNTRNSAKSLLTYGVEDRQSNEWSYRGRINLNRSVAFTTTIRQGTNMLINSSSNFDSSNYDLKKYSVEPDLIYTHKSNLRIGVGYRLSTKLNAPEWGGQNYTSAGINSDFKYNILQSTSIQGKFIFSEITYTSKEGAPSTTSPVSYTILEGLAPGRNFEWGLDFTKRLGNNLEINLQYEGRKPSGQGVINTGRASLRALL